MSSLKDLITRALRAQREYLIKYRAGHTTLGCRITHMLGIPMIMSSILAFALYLLPALEMTIVIVQVAFSQQHLKPFIHCFTQVLPLFLKDVLTDPGYTIYLLTGLALFIVGWIFQYIGHKVFEDNDPLFLSNPFNPLSYTTAVLFIAEEFGQVVTQPFTRSNK